MQEVVVKAKDDIRFVFKNGFEIKEEMKVAIRGKSDTIGIGGIHYEKDYDFNCACSIDVDRLQ